MTIVCSWPKAVHVSPYLWDNGTIFQAVAKRCARKPTSRDLCGYWQGNKKRGEGIVE